MPSVSPPRARIAPSRPAPPRPAPPRPAPAHTLAARVQSTGQRRARDESRRFWESIRAQRLDGGLSLARLAAAAGISPAYLFELEAGEAIASLGVCARVASALGGEASLRYFPGSGPRLRDHLQAAMVDAFLPALHRRWGRRLEVAVAPPLRGFVDLAIDDSARRLSVAAEFQSEIRRVEQQLRWAQAKAEALPTPEDAGSALGEPWVVSRLLVLRSTVRTRQVVAAHAELFRTAYPAAAASALAALTTAGAPWPGPALLWMRVEAGEATLLDRPPRGIRVGR